MTRAAGQGRGIPFVHAATRRVILFRVGRRIFVLIAALASLSVPHPLTAGDWPQILGPHRNGEAENESLADKWPADGPPTAWSKAVGSGFAGVAVSGKTVVLFHRLESNDHEELIAFKAADGSKVWSHSAPTSYTGSIVEDNGPRCVPLIHDDKVMNALVPGAREGGDDLEPRHAR
jgi:outer membrane protein assembly factor BamB